LTEPTWRVAIMDELAPTVTTTSVCSNVVNPCFSTRTLYLPEGKTGTLNCPAEPQTVFLVRPVSAFATVTAAPSTSCRCGSFTCRLIAPVPSSDCPRAVCPTQSQLATIKHKAAAKRIVVSLMSILDEVVTITQ